MSKVTLILPDVHHHWKRAEFIISKIGADEIMFLGDYFDDFGDNPDMVESTCKWLNESVNKPNRIHLFGNHDQQYAFNYRTFRCSGYTQWKHHIINDLVNNDTWNKLKWYYFLDNQWLLTHGGLHKLNVPSSIRKYHIDKSKFYLKIGEWLDEEIIKGLRMAANNQELWIFNAGRYRGGYHKVGGITWCDYNHEFFPIKGLNQIVGHSPQITVPQWCLYDKSFSTDNKVRYGSCKKYFPKLEHINDSNMSHNICLDEADKLLYWAVWDGKELKIGYYGDL